MVGASIAQVWNGIRERLWDDIWVERAISRGNAAYIVEESPYALDDRYVVDHAWHQFRHRLLFRGPEYAAEYADAMDLYDHSADDIAAFVWEQLQREIDQGSLAAAGKIWAAFQPHLDWEPDRLESYLQDMMETHMTVDY